jgi:hypothetical protein
MTGMLLLADFGFLNDNFLTCCQGSEPSSNLAASEYKYPKLLIQKGSSKYTRARLNPIH